MTNRRFQLPAKFLASACLLLTTAATGLAGGAGGVQSPPVASVSTPVWPPAITPLPFALKRTLTASTPAEFITRYNALVDGDRLKVAPMTLTGEIVLVRRLTAGSAEVRYADGVRFTGTAAGSNLPTVWWRDEGINHYGGDVTGKGYDCIRMDGVQRSSWLGVKIHDCAHTGLTGWALKDRANLAVLVKAELWNNGLDLTLDPHHEKGTGMHGAYLGGGGIYSTSGRFVLDVHDQPSGAAVQVGANLVDSEIWLRARRITKVATSQFGGNALQFWGGGNRNVLVHYVEADQLAGRVVEADIGTGGAGSGIVVEYARATNVRLTPRYRQDPGILYKDVG